VLYQSILLDNDPLGLQHVAIKLPHTVVLRVNKY